MSEIRDAFVLLGHATRLPDKFSRAIEGRPIAERVTARLEEAGYRPTFVSVRPRRTSTVPTLLDRFNRGPLGGVRAILEARRGPFLLVGGDMPFLSVEDLRRLRALHRPGVCVVPRWANGTLEVLHALYDLPLEVVRAEWERGSSLRDLVRERPGAVFPPAEGFEPLSFVDIDTPADWERWRHGPRAGVLHRGARSARR